MIDGSPTPETWNEVSKAYTTTIDGSSREIADSIARIMQAQGINPGSRLLELGCGSGHLSACLNKAGYITDLLDFSPDSLEIARKTFDEHGIKGAFIQGDLFDLNTIPNKDYDLVWNSGVMEHFSDERIFQALRNAREIAKRALFIVPNPKSISYLLMRYFRISQNDWPYGKEFLRTNYIEMVHAAGFDDVSTYYIGKAATRHNFWLAMKDADNFEVYEDMLERDLLPEEELYLIGYFSCAGAETPTSLASPTSPDTETFTDIVDINAERFGLKRQISETNKKLDDAKSRADWLHNRIEEMEIEHSKETSKLKSELERAIAKYEFDVNNIRTQLAATLEEHEEETRKLKNEHSIELDRVTRSREHMRQALENANHAIKQALYAANDLFDTKLFKLLHLLSRTGRQLIVGKWKEKKNYFRWLKAHITHRHYVDSGYNPIHRITEILEGTHCDYAAPAELYAIQSVNIGVNRAIPADHMRILYVYKWATMGGVERVFLNRARVFKQHNIKVVIDVYFLHDSGGLKNFNQYIRHFGLEDYLNVVQGFNEQDYSIIVTFDTHEIFNVLSDFSKVVIECHTPYEEMREYLSSIPKNVAAIVSPSAAFKDAILIKELPSVFHDKLYVLPNFCLDNNDDNTPYRIWAKIPICYIGRMDSLKNTMELLEIFGRLRMKVNDSYILILAGNIASNYIDLNSVIKQLGIEDRVLYFPPLPFEKVDELLKTIKYHQGIFISPSRGESFGLSVLEAMTNGVPVVLSDIECHSALVGGDRDFLYELGNINEAVAKIEMIKNNYDDSARKAEEFSRRYNCEYFLEQWSMFIAKFR